MENIVPFGNTRQNKRPRYRDKCDGGLEERDTAGSGAFGGGIKVSIGRWSLLSCRNKFKNNATVEKLNGEKVEKVEKVELWVSWLFL